ncbi:TonB-dependent receptor [Altererythrobacter sp. FM1]|uniref:TonB-dependent siderophore receptor n=1 Tax=Tsuneonella flava TaxID=2055955 RepID=UPI000C800DF2|nr:TonB-dependent receptor [Tsuneonella flava]ROT94147.1 TonB-dependent receptor [Altererythrobacter sp. FM1]
MRISIIALTAALAAPTSAFAQDQQQEGWTPDTIIVTGERDEYQVQDAGVLRGPISIQETPQSVQVLTSALIQDQELNTLDEALANISNVTPSLSSEILLTNPIVRGFQAEIFADGLIGYGDTAVSDPASLWNVERIEVAKGPTATLFGGGVGAPVGGLINLVSKTANFENGFSGRVRVGSFDTYAIAADGNLALSDNAGIRLVGEYQSAGDYIDEVDIDRILLAPSIRLQPAEGTEIVGRITYSRVKQLEYTGLPATLADDPTVMRDRFTSASDAPRSVIENFSGSLDVTQQLASGISASVRVRRYKSNFDEYSSSPYFAFFPCTGTVCPELNGVLRSDVGEWTVDGSLTAEVTTGGIEHVLLVGAQWDKVHYFGTIGSDLFNVGLIDLADPASNLNYILPPDGPPSINEYSTLALYAQDQITIGDRFHLLGSIRYSRMRINEVAGGVGNDEVYHEINPRIGATIDLTEGVSIFAGYATGSRLPLFFNGTNSPMPEESESFEGGLKLALPELGLSGTISAFKLTRTNVPTPDPNTFLTSIQTGRQESSGLELDLIYEPSRAFSLLASYGYVDAKVTEDTVIPVGDRLARVPHHRGRIAARYRFLNGAMQGFELGAGLTGVSDAYITLPNGAKVDGYVVADAQASYDFGSVRLGLRVDNLFNRRYFTPYSYYAQDVVRPGTPRSAFVTAAFNF